MNYCIEMQHICKKSLGIAANDGISLQIKEGEIHAILGESGAGKSTLMNILFGLTPSDGGHIKVRGEEVSIKSPKDAQALGIGMIHQDLPLVDTFTIRENIILGEEGGFFLFPRAITHRIEALSERYSLPIDLGMKIEECSVGIRLRVEILKMLYRKANILILDEPTALLTPLEIADLMLIMQTLSREGKTIIFITPRINEVKEVADRCTIIRRGKLVGVVNVQETSQAEMFAMMAGRPVSFKAEKKGVKGGRSILELFALEVLDNKKRLCIPSLSLSVKSGEIVGLVGAEGHGQVELVEAITGLRPVEGGAIILDGNDITHASVAKRGSVGLGYIPQQRHSLGLIMESSIVDTIAIKEFSNPPFSHRGIINTEAIHQYAQDVITQFAIEGREGVFTLVGELSEENRQKLLVGREVLSEPALLIAVEPTRALDIKTKEHIHSLLLAHRDKEYGVLVISSDLDEVFAISDRIAVIHSGEIVGVVNCKETDRSSVSLMMAGIEPKGGV